MPTSRHSARSSSGDEPTLDLAAELLPLTVPELRRLLWHLVWPHRPDIAAALTEWNAYVSPVPAGGEIVQQNAAEANGAQAQVLNSIASSPYVFPDDELASRLYSYRVLDGEEIQQWNDLFQPIYLS